MTVTTLSLVVALLACLGALALLVAKLRRARGREVLAEVTARELAQDKRNLMQHLGHEIRNPINAILGMADMTLDERSLPADLVSNLQVIRGAANQVMMVAANLAAYQTGEDRPLQEQRVELTVSELIKDVTQSLSEPLLVNRSQLEVHHEMGAPSQIEADPQFLMLVLRNVLAYSIGETKGGHVTVTVHAPDSDRTSAADTLFVSITDNGVSPTTADVPTMFEAYGNNAQLRSTVDPGTGLSLGVARNIAHKLGGDVTYERHPNGGNIFSIRLPTTIRDVVTPENDPQTHVVLAFNHLYTAHRQSVASQRILVTEDQRSNQQLIRAILRKAGHDVTIAATGDEAIQLLQEATFDMGVMDLRLPGTSGLDVMQLTRLSAVGANRQLPFIVLTGETTESIRQACIAAGATAFLAKPISAQRLLDTVRTVVERVERIHAEMANTREQVNRFVNVAAASLSPRQVSESMKDAMRYVAEAKQALANREFTAARQRFRAVRGTSYVLGATHLGDLCGRLLALNDGEIERSKQMISEQLDKSIFGTRESLALVTKRDLD